MVNADLKFRIGRRLGRMIEKPRIRDSFLGRACDYLERSYHNIGSELEYYGELEVIDRLSALAFEGSIILDVGANRGQYARHWLHRSNNVTVISFEIDPDLHAVLSEAKTSYGNRWHVEPFGLSDRQGEFKLFKSTRSDEVTSLVAIPGSEPSTNLARVEIAETYLAKLPRPALFMKVDTEGHELPILQSATVRSELLPQVIQFEFGHPQVSSRSFLKDFFDCLANRYHIGKIYQCGVDFKEYDHITDELFRMCNYIAVLRSREDIIAALSCKR